MTIAHRDSRTCVVLRIGIGRPGRRRTESRGGTPPTKLDHFELTQPTPNLEGQFEVFGRLMDELGGRPQRLAVRLLDNDLSRSFSSEYSLWSRTDKGVQCLCRGDGLRATRQTSSGPIDVPCRAIPSDNQPKRGQAELLRILRDPQSDNPMAHYQCAFAQNRIPKRGPSCALHSSLICVLDKQTTVGGVARFKSTGKRTHDKLLGSLEVIQRVTGGQLEGLPLVLVLAHESTQYEDADGKLAFTKVPVVHLELNIPMAEVLQVAAERAAQRRLLTEQVQESRRLLEAAIAEPVDAEMMELEFPQTVNATVSFDPAGDPGATLKE